MTLWLAIAGWAVVTALAVQAARLTRRLELVARADHELRGPVAALALAVEALGRNPELRRRAAALDAHIDRLRLGLADLDAARDGRRARARPAEVSLEGAARAVAEAWQPAARGTGGEITFEWRAGPVVARTDRARLSQALGNVVANAVEHGGERIAVSGERQGNGVRIAVRDDGRASHALEPGSRGLGGSGLARRAGSRPRRRGRGLTIAAHALEDARGSLQPPAFAGLRSSSTTQRGEVAPTGAGERDTSDAGPLRPGARGVPASGTEVRIDLPVVESSAP